MNNILFNTDSYKLSHPWQYPKGTDYMFSYVESRGGISQRVMFFGLQYILKEYLCKPFSFDDVNEADEFYKAHGLPFHKAGFISILEKHGGYFPIRIRAVPEGALIPTNNVLMTIESLDPDSFWCVGFLETLLMRIWYPITVATISYGVKQKVRQYMEECSDNLDDLPFKLHDFGSRGVSSMELS